MNSSGGMVHTLDITDPQRQAALKRVKVGDSLTAIGTEAFAIALEPVGHRMGDDGSTYDQITALPSSRHSSGCCIYGSIHRHFFD